MQQVIETERLLLKEVNPEIMTFLFSTYSDEGIMNLLGLETAAELETEKSNYRQGLSWYRATFRSFLVVHKESGKRIGKIGFHTWYTQHSRAEIGYDIQEGLPQ
ncbi:hypothetical protein GCM10023093_06280 [Nemorincola caseinilytica]|uniref:N-acetyltransferase domain-containing protein n=1 Tax=Nemorincola caseinilytica TaxID=2054315 RepID=A0ABP8N868_9BACT